MLLFWVSWTSGATSTKNYSINLYKVLMFICMQTINVIPHSFLKIMYRYYKVFIQGTLGMPLRKTLTFIFMQKINFILHFFLKILQRLQIYYFGWFGHGLPSPPKMIVSASRKLLCLPTSRKSTWHLTSILRYFFS